MGQPEADRSADTPTLVGGSRRPQLPMLRAFLAIICLRAWSDGGTLVSREPVAWRARQWIACWLMA